MELSASFVLDTKKTNLKHNNREMNDKEKEKNDHINFDRNDKNKYLIQQDLENFYEKEFGEALENYNKKQKRADRKINNYYEHIKSGKKSASQQELIIQFGDYDFFKDSETGSENNREVFAEMLELYLEGFQERNPNLKVYNAVIHDDEASPHMHLNFVPVASGYESGLEKQVSFNRALNQQSDELNVDRPFVNWREQEVGELSKILEMANAQRKEVGTNYFLDVNEYKKGMRERANDHQYIKVLDDLKNAQKLNLELQNDSKDVENEKLMIKVIADREKKELEEKFEQETEALRLENEGLKQDIEEVILQNEEQKGIIKSLKSDYEYFTQNFLTLYNTASNYLEDRFEEFKELFREDIDEQGYESELDVIEMENEDEDEMQQEKHRDNDMDM